MIRFCLILVTAACLSGCGCPTGASHEVLQGTVRRMPSAGAMKCGGGRCDPIKDPDGFKNDPECSWERENCPGGQCGVPTGVNGANPK